MTIDRETMLILAARAGSGWANNGTEPLLLGEAQLERFAALVLEHGRKPLTDEQIEMATGAKRGQPLFLVAKGFTTAIESAHGITNKESSDAE